MRSKLKLWLQAIALFSLPFLFSGCETVQPWERGNLADYTMQADRDSLEASMQEHIFFTREAATGGKGVGGGGCGCN